MRGGDLRSFVTIQHQVGGQDDIGQPVTTWAPLASVWARIDNMSGMQTIKAGAETSIVKTAIRIRRRSDVTAGMQVVYGTATYLVKAVLPDEQTRQYTDLACEVVS